MPTAYAGAVSSLTWDDVRSRRLARSHLRRAGAGGTARRGRPRRLRHPRAGDGLRRAPARRARRGDHAGRRPRGALGAAGAREDVDAARHAAHPPVRRARSLDGGAARGRRRGRLRHRGARRSSPPSSPRSARRWPAARLTREELADAVVARVGPAPREQLASGWGYYLGDAAEAGVLCFGPPSGSKVTFVHASDWLGPQREWEPREALREVARRYAATYGPVSPPAVPRVVHLAQLHRGRRARTSSTSSSLPEPEPAAAAEASVRLLPEYDPYVMGFREREHLVPPEVREQVAAHGKGRYEGPAGTPFLARRRHLRGDLEPEEDRARGSSWHVRAGAEADAGRTRRRRGGGGADRRLPRARSAGGDRLSMRLVPRPRARRRSRLR